MIQFFNKAISICSKPHYADWENNLAKKLNIVTYLSFINIVLAVVFFELFEYTFFRYECLFALIVLPLTFVFNYKKNYIWAVYCYYITDFIFFIPINLKMGLSSYSILFYFPMIISLVQLLGRRETLKHLIFLSSLCILTIVIVTIGLKFDTLRIVYDETLSSNLALLNILLGYTSTILLVLLLVIDYIKQEEVIRRVLKEKEILLAEVFHRVKNNMNIVTSLLSLKKNTSEQKEVKEALEECRSRVYSMALVHQNIFNENNLIGLNFKDYIKNLTDEIAKSLGDSKTFDIILDTEEIELNLSTAIPCGLILNELITNSFKYALSDENRLQINISLKQLKNGMIELIVRDNGPGIPQSTLDANSTLGIELVKSLSEQINGKYKFENKNGLQFTLDFKQDV